MAQDGKVSLVYCSAGCSRSRHALSAAPFTGDGKGCDQVGGFVAYASSNFVSIIEQSKVYAKDCVDAFSIVDTPSLRNAQTEVSCVFWLSPNLLLFGNSDGTLCLYSTSNRHLFSKKLHVESITSVHACEFKEGSFLVASCSADGVARVSLAVRASDGTYSLDGSTFQDIKCGSRTLPLEVNLSKLSHFDSLLLSVGCDDGSIRLFISKSGMLKFQHAIQLSGHTDWITSLSTCLSADGKLLFLASGSQDSTVRLWKFYSVEDEKSVSAQNGDGTSPLIGLQKSSINFECPWFSSSSVFIRLETILKGHADWVYSVDICVDKATALMNILTCSIDRSVIVWQEPCDKNSEGIWQESARFARIGGTGSAAGMSYCGARFAQGGQTVVAHSFTGALHAWRRTQQGGWVSIPMPSGHLGAVADLAWEPTKGMYLLTVGADQTTRLHSSWHKSPSLPTIWYEFGRPQVHGFSFNAVTTLNSTSFVSAADEKAMRVFSMPRLVKDSLSRLCKFDAGEESVEESTGSSKNKKSEALGATVPPLGLTNRPYGEDDGANNDENAGEDFGGDMDDEEGGGKRRQKTSAELGGAEQRLLTTVSFVHEDQPPTPEILVQHSLWPEMRKLYGHGSEVFAVDVSPVNATSSSERLIASSCKATSAESAQIILWSPWSPSAQSKSANEKMASFDWRPVQHLEGATLTVTQLLFSHSGEFLIAVSRDRTWHLYRRTSGDEKKETSVMKRVASLDKQTSPHSRIIWTCDWSCDDRMFATGSRDQQILIWQLDKVVATGATTQPKFSASVASLPSAITALAFVPTSLAGQDSATRYLLVAGFESGNISVYQVTVSADGSKTEAGEVHRFPTALCPSKSISRLRFRPSSSSEKHTKWHLAASSEDWSCRLFELDTHSLLS